MITLPPSKAHVWGPCPGAPTVWASAPELPVTQDMREGIAAHTVVSRMIADLQATGRVPHSDYYVNQRDNYGVTITREMYLAALEVFEDVLGAMDEYGANPAECILSTEKHLKMPHVSPVTEGPADVVLLIPKANVLLIWEFKYGHRPVRAVGNPQLALYVLGWLQEHKVDGLREQHLQVDLRVVQPRSFLPGASAFRRWTGAASSLRATWNWLRSSAEAALGPNPTVSVGPHCIECQGRHACPKVLEAALAAFQFAGDAVAENPSVEALAAEAKMLALAEVIVKARKSAVDLDIESRVLSGKFIPGWAAEQTPGRRRWAVPAADVRGLGDAFGIPLVEETPVSPAEAERRLKAAGVPQFKEMVKSFTETPPGGIKIVPDDGSKAMQVFGAKPL